MIYNEVKQSNGNSEVCWKNFTDISTHMYVTNYRFEELYWSKHFGHTKETAFCSLLKKITIPVSFLKSLYIINNSSYKTLSNKVSLHAIDYTDVLSNYQLRSPIYSLTLFYNNLNADIFYVMPDLMAV